MFSPGHSRHEITLQRPVGCIISRGPLLVAETRRGVTHVGISTYFREFWTFVGCRENLREK